MSDVLQEVDRKALQLNSAGDYFQLQCGDVENALKCYRKSLELVTTGNTVLRRELAEVIPICLAQLGRIDEAFILMQEMSLKIE